MRMKDILLIGALATGAILPAEVSAADLSKLTPGLYMPRETGCGFVGGAGTTLFDGHNFSGHYQVCETKPVAGSANTYQSTCIEAQGPDQPTIKDIANNPDRETEKFSISILSPKSFTRDGAAYDYCAAR